MKDREKIIQAFVSGVCFILAIWNSSEGNFLSSVVMYCGFILLGYLAWRKK